MIFNEIGDAQYEAQSLGHTKIESSVRYFGIALVGAATIPRTADVIGDAGTAAGHVRANVRFCIGLARGGRIMRDLPDRGVISDVPLNATCHIATRSSSCCGLPCPALGCMSIPLVDRLDRIRYWELAR